MTDGAGWHLASAARFARRSSGRVVSGPAAADAVVAADRLHQQAARVGALSLNLVRHRQCDALLLMAGYLHFCHFLAWRSNSILFCSFCSIINFLGGRVTWPDLVT